MEMDPATHFTRELGFGHEVVKGLARGWAWNLTELCLPGTEFPHIAVMLTVSDIVTGILAGIASAPRRLPSQWARSSRHRGPMTGTPRASHLMTCRAIVRSSRSRSPSELRSR
jgi:hypothetical protein